MPQNGRAQSPLNWLTPERIILGEWILLTVLVGLLLFLLFSNRRLQQTVRSEQLINTRSRSGRIAVEKERDLLQSLIDSIPDLIFYKCLSGYYIGCNKAFARHLGVEREKIAGCSDEDLFPKELARSFRQTDQAIIKTKKHYVHEAWVEDPDHGRILHHTVKSPYYDAQGQMLGIIGISRNVTEIKRVQESLVRHDAILQAIAYASEVFLRCSFSQENWNGFLEQLGKATGVERVYVFENYRDDLGRLLASIRFEWKKDEVESRIDEPLLQSLCYQERGLGRWERLLANGEAVWGSLDDFEPPEQLFLNKFQVHSMMNAPIFVGDKWWGVIGFSDYSAQREWAVSEIDALKTAAAIVGAAMQRSQVEDEVRRNTQEILSRTRQLNVELERRELILRGIGDGVIVVDLNFNVILINQASRHILGIDSGTTFSYQLRHLFIYSTLADANLEAAMGQGFVDFDVMLPCIQAMRSVKMSCSRFLDEAGEPAGWVLVLRDVTREREIDRMKTDFISSVSHELRTPLTSIKGFTSTILNDPDMPVDIRQDFLKSVDEESDRLAGLIEELLEISRIETGHLQLCCEMVDLRELIESTLHTFQQEFERHGLHCCCDLDDVPVSSAWCDANRTRAILVNLVGNAIKFTPAKGKIWVGLSQKREGYLAFEVSDTGMGIPEKDLPHIFDRFFRCYRPGLEIQGTGLGLAIVKEFVELQHGDIEVTSRIGEGSTFTVHLPLVEPKRGALSSVSHEISPDIMI